LNKRAIVTRSDDGQRPITEITFPIIQRYADKCDADFLSIIDPRGLHPHYRILQFYEMFDEYERILSIDSDILILKTCPNIFDEVPYEKIGTIFEDVGSRKDDRRERIQKAQEKYGDIKWTEGYPNSGFMVVSNIHKSIFYHDENTELYDDLGFDDVYLGYQINKEKIEIHELSYKFNFQSLMSEDWNNNESRFGAHCIHYSGNGSFLPCRSRLECLKEDKLILEKYDMLI